jgi:RNA polymerase sigma-70 factor, ECF subfamily
MPELVYSAATEKTRRREALREADDRALLFVLRSGVNGEDEQALDELIRRKTRALTQVAARILNDEEEARDVVQVTFVRLWENRDRYDPKYSPNTWIYRITTNLAIDLLRSRRSREKADEPFRHHIRRVEDGRSLRDFADLQLREVGRIFRELAGYLSEKQRLVFLLKEVEGLSSAEVAEIAGCRESTVRNHLFNARRALRRELLVRYPEYARMGAKASAEEMELKVPTEAEA